jgi:hypothetical protein
MKANSRNLAVTLTRWLARALVPAVLALAGCAGAPPKAPEPPTGATPVNFARVALVSLSSTPEFDMQIPRTNAAALGAATAALRFAEKLKDTLLRVAEQQAGCTLAAARLPLPTSAAAPPCPPQFPGMQSSSGQSHRAAQATYLALAEQGFKTVLEIKCHQPGLVGSEAMNPRLAVSVDVRVRLLDAASGREIYYDYLQYRGPKRRFAEWAAIDAQPLRDELESCCRKLADEIVAQAFVRPDTASVDAVALAQSGIRRK